MDAYLARYLLAALAVVANMTMHILVLTLWPDINLTAWIVTVCIATPLVIAAMFWAVVPHRRRFVWWPTLWRKHLMRVHEQMRKVGA